MDIKQEISKIAKSICSVSYASLLKQAVGKYHEISQDDIMQLPEFKGTAWKLILNAAIDLENKGIIKSTRDSFTGRMMYKRGPKFS